LTNVVTGYLPADGSSSDGVPRRRSSEATTASDDVVEEIPLPISVAISSSEFDADGGGALHRFYTPSEPSPHMRGARSIPTTPTETAASRGVFGFRREGEECADKMGLPPRAVRSGA
jgi:hypothetical protein